MRIILMTAVVEIVVSVTILVVAIQAPTKTFPASLAKPLPLKGTLTGAPTQPLTRIRKGILRRTLKKEPLKDPLSKTNPKNPTP